MRCHGRLDNYLGMGVNNLIKEGAILTTTIEDILINYPQFKDRVCKRNFLNSNHMCKDIRKVLSKKIINTEYDEIYNIIKNGYSNLEEIFEQITNENNKSITILMEKLINMELEGLIKKELTGGYIVIE